MAGIVLDYNFSNCLWPLYLRQKWRITTMFFYPFQNSPYIVFKTLQKQFRRKKNLQIGRVPLEHKCSNLLLGPVLFWNQQNCVMFILSQMPKWTERKEYCLLQWGTLFCATVHSDDACVFLVIGSEWWLQWLGRLWRVFQIMWRRTAKPTQNVYQPPTWTRRKRLQQSGSRQATKGMQYKELPE